jgi:predicted dehydrogenase
MNRKDFLKNSAMAAIPIVAVRGLNLNQAKGKKVENVIRVGLVGCGGRGTGAAVQALNAHPSVRLVALADVFEDKIQETLKLVQAEFPDRVDVPVARQFKGFDGYLGLINEVDVMLNATPPYFRPIHAEACANAGKHMFLEKPVAVDMAGIKRMMAVQKMAQEKGLVVTVGLNMRYSANMRRINDKIRAGAIGDIILSRANGNFGRVSWLKMYPRVAGMSEMEYQMRNWYFFNWLSGDIIVEQTVHLTDAISFFRNGVYPVEAQGSGGRAVRVGPDAGDVFDHFAVEYTYADNTKAFVLARQIQGTWTTFSAYADGTLGTCGGDRIQMRGEKEPTILPKDTGPEGHQVEHNEMFADIIAGKSRDDLKHGIPSTVMAILGREAAYSGVIVKWDEAMASNQDLKPSAYNLSAIPQHQPGQDGIYPYPMPGLTKPFMGTY